MRGGGVERYAREGLARRSLKAAAVLLLTVAICALMVVWLKPAHNHIGVTVDKRAAARPAPAPMATLCPTGGIRVNYAPAEELERISGVGSALAAQIIAQRETNGRFAYPEDLLVIRGIGRATLMKLLPQITLE